MWAHGDIGKLLHILCWEYVGNIEISLCLFFMAPDVVMANVQFDKTHNKYRKAKIITN